MRGEMQRRKDAKAPRISPPLHFATHVQFHNRIMIIIIMIIIIIIMIIVIIIIMNTNQEQRWRTLSVQFFGTSTYKQIMSYKQSAQT